MDMSVLFSPLKLRTITLKNRLAVSPMCQYSSKEGFANDWHFVHYGSRAVGGAGLVMLEATAISPEGRISPYDLGIWNDEHIGKLKQVAGFIEAGKAIPGIQLAHAGRKAGIAPEWEGGGPVRIEDGGWRSVSPSPIAFREDFAVPEELNHMGIRKVLDNFASAADRAIRAGFKVIEIHAAHGYLLHEFMSPLSNRRHDEYGGSFQNRVRLLLEAVDTVKAQTKDVLPVFVRISATDWEEGGWDVEQSVQLARLLKQKGVDLIDVSSGGLVPRAKMEEGPGFQVPFSGRIRREAAISTSAVGMITSAVQAEAVLEAGDADLIFMGREFLRNPYAGLYAASDLGEGNAWPVQYRRAEPCVK